MIRAILSLPHVPPWGEQGQTHPLFCVKLSTLLAVSLTSNIVTAGGIGMARDARIVASSTPQCVTKRADAVAVSGTYTFEPRLNYFILCEAFLVP